MGSPADKERLFALLYEAKFAICDEKAAAWDRFNAAVDQVRSGTIYSRMQVRDLLYHDGYWEYAKRRRLTERSGL